MTSKVLGVGHSHTLGPISPLVLDGALDLGRPWHSWGLTLCKIKSTGFQDSILRYSVVGVNSRWMSYLNTIFWVSKVSITMCSEAHEQAIIFINTAQAGCLCHISQRLHIHNEAWYVAQWHRWMSHGRISPVVPDPMSKNNSGRWHIGWQIWAILTFAWCFHQLVGSYYGIAIKWHSIVFQTLPYKKAWIQGGSSSFTLYGWTLQIFRFHFCRYNSTWVRHVIHPILIYNSPHQPSFPLNHMFTKHG